MLQNSNGFGCCGPPHPHCVLLSYGFVTSTHVKFMLVLQDDSPREADIKSVGLLHTATAAVAIGAANYI